jgi:hypothetical protein
LVFGLLLVLYELDSRYSKSKLNRHLVIHSLFTPCSHLSKHLQLDRFECSREGCGLLEGLHHFARRDDVSKQFVARGHAEPLQLDDSPAAGR